MRAFALQPVDLSPESISGTVLCHDVVGVGALGRVKLGKGRSLSADDLPVLQTAGTELHLLRLDADDVHEDQASVRLATAVAGHGIALRPPVESQTLLRAQYRGIFRVNAGALQRINALPDISVFTVYDGQPVEADRALGAAKVTPLAIAASIVEQAEALAAEAFPVARVDPFVPIPVAVVVRERLTVNARERFEASIQLKLEWFGSPLAGIRYVSDDIHAIAEAINEFVDAGVGLLLAAGVNSTDPLDPTIQALDMLGAVTEQRGVPAHPGSTCWLSYLHDVPIFGLALCGMFSRSTVLDLLLPRFLSGHAVRAADLAVLGHGGMLGPEMAFRFPAYGTATSPDR